MLAMARALLLQPKLLVLDEPSTGLAPLLVAEIFDIVQTLRRDLGVVSMLLTNEQLDSRCPRLSQWYEHWSTSWARRAGRQS